MFKPHNFVNNSRQVSNDCITQLENRKELGPYDVSTIDSF